ncbi:hypothetical protein M0802_009275 [Mischocyttarus mexicanus]|nr:hypothetical protein M0802_009275 [Mischocyttarus mexicanus]
MSQSSLVEIGAEISVLSQGADHILRMKINQSWKRRRKEGRKEERNDDDYYDNYDDYDDYDVSAIVQKVISF